MLPTVEESRGYDFQDPENAEKWKGFFISSLRKVLESVHPTLTAEESALEFVESLCLRLLGMLCALPAPLSVTDGEERVARSFPTPLDRWALTEWKEASLRRRKLLLPLDRLHLLLQKEVLLFKIDISVTTFMTVILEFISKDILRLAGNFVKKISQKSGYQVVTCSDIKTAMCADKMLIDMFYQDSELASIVALPGFNSSERGRRASLSYSDLVRDLLADERTFLRDINLIIRVFKEELEKIVDDNKVISLIFGNIVDIYELTVTLLGNLEDAMEMSQDTHKPYIGSCFEELAEVEEFRAFVRYANIVTRRESRDALAALVDDPQLGERLETAGHGFRLAVKYCLPRLLLAPVAHVFLYHSYVLAMLPLATASDDRESFKQVECNLHPIEKLLTRALGNGPQLEGAIRSASRARRKLAIDKCNELGRLVDNWDSRDVPQCCNEFIREDTLSKLGPGKRVAERRAFLFDGLLLLCKPVTSLMTVNSGVTTGPPQLKLKEKLHIRKLDIVDRPDGEEGRNLMELCPRVGPPVVLAAASPAEKRYWMSDLVMLNTKPMLDRSLDSILLDLERRHPLRLPSPALYRFAEPDGPHNLVLEHAPGPAPLIKGATLLKLVERLTYHVHADLNLVRTFLTTYRSFCSPAELLALLVERFDIPEPHLVYDAPRPVPRIKIPKKDISPNASLLDLDLDIAECVEISASSDAEKLSKNTAREDWKRYRKEFQQPVKFRVINVLRHWVDQHFYDFETEPSLLARLRDFLESVDGKPMKKWVQSVLKTVQRKCVQSDTESVLSLCSVSHVFDRLPPAPLGHVAEPERHAWHPLALHPLEAARQLTLLEFQLYRQVKPSELVGAVWTKKDKEKTSPNLFRISKHTTNLTRWMEKWVVESENLEERAAVLSWFLELAAALSDLNNFNGVFAVVAACESASVYRLKYTFQMLPLRHTRALEQFRELSSDHFRLYQERLRSINPPCVPFVGVYLTKILHIEEGNLDFLPNTELINFSKRRMVAEITGEIQQYQNQPYCLTLEPRTRAFLETLDPFPGMDDNEVTNYLYAKSKEIEPKGAVKQTPKFPRRYPDLSLKPVKVSRRRHEPSSSSLLSSTTSLISLDGSLGVSQLSPPGGAWDGGSVVSLPVHALDHGQYARLHGGSDAPRDGREVPRLERCSSSSLAQLSLRDKLFDKSKSVSTLHRNSGSTKDEPPSPRDNHSPKRRPALSPRGALVEADSFYNRRRPDQAERVPPLLPRGEAEAPPALPRRPPSPRAGSTEPPPEPPDRPSPSPKHHDLFRSPALSPRRSPAPAPPSPADRAAFSFPAPEHVDGAPPPLPPRRRRDSAAPPTPHPPSCGECGPSPPAPSPCALPGPPPAPLPPPPLPPRPPPAPELLRPAHSALLQRRHTAASAPKRPPKPTAAAVAPRT